MVITTKTRMFFDACCILFATLFLSACASSAVQREANNQFHTAYENATSGNISDANPVDAFHTSSQRTKGIIFGGVAGAVVGSMTSGVGTLPGAAGGAIFGGALGAYIDAHTTLRDQLDNRGIKVIVLGDQVLIVLPSSHIFNGMTPEINPYGAESLDLVAMLINTMPNISVNIAAYTNATGSQRVSRVLSQEQANNVEKYLWRRGVNTRMIYATGMGGTKLVEANNIDNDFGDNYRVEITLEKVPV